MGFEVTQLRALSDNYVYLLRDAEAKLTAVVDPSEAAPVVEELESCGWKLHYILNTHHHPDHTGGNLELKRRYGAKVVGHKGDRHRIPGIDIELEDGDRWAFGESQAMVYAIPGHTLGHISFWFEEERALFCGDTLFLMGCGRLFEGTPQQMWTSLSRIRELPPATRVFCGHEYTQANGEFALTIEPENSRLKSRQNRVLELRRNGIPTVPATLAEELLTNPFLRADQVEVQEAVGMRGREAWEVFAEIRRRKDRF